MARQSPAVKRALPTRDCNIIEICVEVLTRNLLGTAQGIGFADGADLERIVYHPDNLAKIRDAYTYFSHVVSKSTSMEISDFPAGTHKWDISIKLNFASPRTKTSRSIEKYGWINVNRDLGLRQSIESIPDDLREIIAAHVHYRYRTGVEIGICRKIVRDVLDKLSFMQLKKVWPELLQYATGVNDKLDTKLSKTRECATTRVVMPDWWNDPSPTSATPCTIGSKYMAAIRMATMTLTKCAVLEAHDRVKHAYITNVSMTNGKPLVAPWDSQPIPVV